MRQGATLDGICATVYVITRARTEPPMLALADPPDTQPDLTPGLVYSPEWHREQEAAERAYLDARIRWYRRHRLPLMEEGTQ
jgi:hypothetical protein